MTLELVTIPCLEDNYAFLIGNPDTGEAALVDVPEAAPIDAALTDRGWALKTILLTHHHWDHVDGLKDLQAKSGAAIVGAESDAHRLPPLDHAVSEGETIDVLGEACEIYDVSGHTVNHIAFHMPKAGMLFTGDSLMAMGCGRLFEGTPAQMWESLQKLRALPDDTTVCSGHEYTLTNCKFTQALEEQNADLTSRISQVEQDRAAGRPTVPSKLGLEKATNPFLRADAQPLMAALGMADAPPSEVFAAIRKRRDTF